MVELFSGPELVHVTEFVADDEGQFAFGIREQLGQCEVDLDATGVAIRVDHRFLVDLQLNAVRVRNQLLRSNSRAELREHVPYHKEVRSGQGDLSAGEAGIDPAVAPESQCRKVISSIFRIYANRSNEILRQVRDDLAE